MLVKITTKHTSYSLVTFVTHKSFAVPFFLPSCCINSLTLTNEPDPSSGDILPTIYTLSELLRLHHTRAAQL